MSRSELMRELRIVDKIADVPAAAWDALVRDDASPFVEHAWLAALEEAGCVGERAGWIPYHLVLYEGGDLVAAAPAYIKTNSEGEFVFDWSWADLASRMGLSYYPKLILAVPFTPASGHRVLWHPSKDRAEMVAVFAHALRTITKELELSSAHVLFPEPAEAELWEQAGMMMRCGVQYHWSNRAGAPFADYEDFLKTLPQKKRTQIRRERKQPSLDGMTIQTIRAEELRGAGGAAIAATMYDLYTSTVDKYFYGRRYLNRRFFELVRQRFAERLAWTVARDADGDIVAGAFNVKKAGVLYGRYWGTKVDRPFLHFNVCYYHGVDEAIRERLTTFNPGAGGEHKRVRGFVPTVTWSAHHVEDARFRNVLSAHLARERAAIEAYVSAGGDDE
ncbi:MAG: GNAT family N-acetyltransferase [Labilithrix sp.]|nr:GNAT family N-acetyltransferase [Labilithrix sp.]MCW5814299.1 GNAT family N-acetyltransferase [Labilithrix sp.]